MAYMFTSTHFISYHFVSGSFRTQVISYPSHFTQCCSFRTVLIFSFSGRRPEEPYWGGSLRRPPLCLSVCKHVCRRTGIFFRYLHNLILKGTFWPSLKTNPPSGLGEDAITRKCLHIYGKTDRWTNGRRRDPPQKSSSTSSSANDQRAICEGIIHTLPHSCQGSSMRW